MIAIALSVTAIVAAATAAEKLNAQIARRVEDAQR